MRSLSALLLAFLAAACAHGRPLPSTEAGGLFSTEGPLAPAEVAVLAEGARFVLIGESHDSGCDHRVQAELIRALAHRKPAVGLEMVEVGRQPILDRFATGEMEVGELSEALEWNESWGVDFGLYRPIFEVASEESLPLIALNLPREWVRTVGRQGLSALPPEVRESLPPILPAPAAQEAMLRQAFEAHGTLQQGDEAFQRFLTAQSLWDSQMATRALGASATLQRPVVILAGAGHVAHGWGIASRLERLAPGAEVLTIMPWRGGEAPSPDEADVWFHCPPQGKGH